MVQSTAKTVGGYLKSLPAARREQIEVVRNEILKNLPNGYEEVMNWGMITYQIPLERYSDTYNKQPLMLGALASQKNHMAVYLMTIYSSEEMLEWFTSEYKKSGKKLDMGKSCVRFKDISNLPVKLIGEAIAKVSVEDYIMTYERLRK